MNVLYAILIGSALGILAGLLVSALLWHALTRRERLSPARPAKPPEG